MTALADRLLAGAGTDPGRQAAVRLLLALGEDFYGREDIRDWMIGDTDDRTPLHVAWAPLAWDLTDHTGRATIISHGERLVLSVASSLAGYSTPFTLGVALAVVDARLKREIVLAIAHAAGVHREWEHGSRADETATVPAEVEGFPVGHLGGAS